MVAAKLCRKRAVSVATGTAFQRHRCRRSLRIRQLLKPAGFTVGAGRAVNEFLPNAAFCSRFLDGVSYAWQDGNTRELLRLALIFTSAIPLHLGIGVLKMEFGLLMTAGVIGAETPSRQAQQTLGETEA